MTEAEPEPPAADQAHFAAGQDPSDYAERVSEVVIEPFVSEWHDPAWQQRDAILEVFGKSIHI